MNKNFDVLLTFSYVVIPNIEGRWSKMTPAEPWYFC